MEFLPRSELTLLRGCPRPELRRTGSEWASGQNACTERSRSERQSREHSKLPKNLKTNRLEPCFGRAKEIFSHHKIL